MVRLLGIVNCSPDSFSGDGCYSASAAVDCAVQLYSEGASWVDIGGESSRPKSKEVSLEDELNRVIPVAVELSKQGIPFSVDTRKEEVAHRCLDLGARILNSVNGLPLAPLAAKYGAHLVLMHMRGTPRDMHKYATYQDCVAEVKEYLRSAVENAKSQGVSDIFIDPGFGFAKNAEHNFELLRRLNEFTDLGRPLLVGLSRKKFTGGLNGTLAANLIAVQKGARVLRVHDVLEHKQMFDFVEKCKS